MRQNLRKEKEIGLTENPKRSREQELRLRNRLTGSRNSRDLEKQTQGKGA